MTAQKKTYWDPALDAEATKIEKTLAGLIVKWDFKIQSNRSPTLPELCTMWQQLGEHYDLLDTLRKSLLTLWEKLDKETIPQKFEADGVDKIQLPELARSFYPLDKYSASIPKEMKDDAFAWLRKEGHGALITETVNAQTLAAFLRSRLIDENLEPPECMKLTPYKIIGSSKYTPKEGGK